MSEPSTDLMRSLYETYDAWQFATSNEDRLSRDDPRVRQVLRLIRTQRRVLDVGASHGQFARALAAVGHDVIAVDISSRAVELCRALGMTAYRLNVETDPLPNVGCFDAVLALEILEHLIDPLLVLRRLHAVMAPAGVLILSTPNAAYIKWRRDLLLGRLPDFGENRAVAVEPRPYNLLHKTPLTISSLFSTLDMAGFKPALLEPEDYGISPGWNRPVLRGMRGWLRNTWPSLFAGSVVVKCVRLE